MTDPAVEHVLIVGPGRLGLAMGSELVRSGWASRVTFLGRSPPPVFLLPLLADNAVAYQAAGDSPPAGISAVLLTVPDSAIGSVIETHSLPHGPPVLHTSGALSSDVLFPLRKEGSPVGSLHPLVTIASPLRDASALRGASFGVEGDGAAVALAERIVAALGGTPLRIHPDGKPLYHAAAVFASNYVVAVLAVAERLMVQAGVPADEVRPALSGLAVGAARNVEASGPAAALTGPVARGDWSTVASHLGRLSPDDRPLYSVLAREALVLAREAGLSPANAARMAALIEPDPS